MLLTTMLFVGTVASTHAQTTATQNQNLFAQIQILMQMIATLQAQLQESRKAQGLTTTIDSTWKEVKNKYLNISFKHPSDSTVSKVTERVTNNGVLISEIIIEPSGVDPTRVHFFSTQSGIELAKHIKIYSSANIEKSDFWNISIEGLRGIERVDYYRNNDCKNILRVVEESSVVYGSHRVECSTHSKGYDQLQRDVVNSLEIIDDTTAGGN